MTQCILCDNMMFGTAQSVKCWLRSYALRAVHMLPKFSALQEDRWILVLTQILYAGVREPDLSILWIAAELSVF